MSHKSLPWQAEIKRMLCVHEWEPIGFAMDKNTGYCTIRRCRKCGARDQHHEFDAGRRVQDGESEGRSADRFGDDEARPTAD